jgi:hypothetical protein
VLALMCKRQGVAAVQGREGLTIFSKNKRRELRNLWPDPWNRLNSIALFTSRWVSCWKN